jgi:hypothetical protein
MRRARNRFPSAKRPPVPAQEQAGMSKTMSERQEYLATMQQKLEKWGAEMDLLEARANAAMEGTRAKFQAQFSELHSSRLEGQRKLEAIKAATEDSWEQLKVETENVWDAFEDSVYAFKAHFQ